MLRPSILGAALAWAAVQPAYAQEQTSTIDDLSALKSEHGQPESDITLSGNAAFLTQYAKRGFTLSAERRPRRSSSICSTKRFITRAFLRPT